MKGVFTSLAMLFVLAINAQTIDLNKKDITKLEKFDGSNVSFFGLKPGMSRADAVKKLKTLKQFIWKFEVATAPSIDVNSTKEMMIIVDMKPGSNLGGRLPQAMKLVWNNDAKGVSELRLHEIANNFLVGDARRLTIFTEVNLNESILGFLHDKVEESTDKAGFMNFNYPSQHFSYTLTPFDEAAGDRDVFLTFFSK